MSVRPIRQMTAINNNREPRGFNSYHKAQVHKISEIRYAKEISKLPLAPTQEKRKGLGATISTCLSKIWPYVRPYVEIIVFVGGLLALGGWLTA